MCTYLPYRSTSLLGLCLESRGSGVVGQQRNRSRHRAWQGRQDLARAGLLIAGPFPRSRLLHPAGTQGSQKDGCL